MIEGRTIRSSALVRLTFDERFARPNSDAAIKAGWHAFNEFKYGPIGLTPKSPARVADIPRRL